MNRIGGAGAPLLILLLVGVGAIIAANPGIVPALVDLIEDTDLDSFGSDDTALCDPVEHQVDRSGTTFDCTCTETDADESQDTDDEPTSGTVLYTLENDETEYGYADVDDGTVLDTTVYRTNDEYTGGYTADRVETFNENDLDTCTLALVDED